MAASTPPAKRVAKPKVEIDFGALTPTATEGNVVNRRQSMLDKTPVPGWIRESLDKGKAENLTVRRSYTDGDGKTKSVLVPAGKRITIPIEAAKADHLAYLLQQAGTRAGFTVRVESERAKLADGRVVVAFQAMGRVPAHLKAVKSATPGV